MRIIHKLNHNLVRNLRKFCSNFSTHIPHDTPEATKAFQESVSAHGKASFDFQYLFGLEKTQLVYKIIRLQRQVDSYLTMKSLTNVDGRDKVRVDHPDLEDIIDQYVQPYRKVAFKVVYLGWDYMAYAWSSRVHDRSVKGHTNVVERVFLEALLRQQLIRNIGPNLDLDRCGRTDKDVSGLSQVVCVSVRSNLTEGYGVKKGFESREDFLEMKLRKREARTKRKLAKLEGVEEEWEERKIEPELNVEPDFSIHDRDSDHLEIPYVKLLNEALPPDIRVLAWSPVSKNFSARASCLSRTYRYFFPRGDLDVDLMHESAQKLVGEHDFRYFGKLSVDNMTKDTVRSMKKFTIEVLPNRTDPSLPGTDICFATISASGFVYRQVRLMMSILYAVGKGICPPSFIDDLLYNIDDEKGRPAYSSFEAYPLMLYDAEYDEEDIDWRWDEDSLLGCAAAIGTLWTEKAMKVEILRTIFSSIVSRIPEERKMEAQGFLVDCLSSRDGDDIYRPNGMKLSKSRTQFLEKEKARSIRRLIKKGKYDHAAALYTSGEAVKWKF